MGRGTGVRAVGAQSIQIDFKYRGVRCREWLRLEPNKANLKYATNLKARIEHEIATHSFDYAKHFPDSPRVKQFADPVNATSLRDALEAYIRTREGSLEPETIKDYRKCASALCDDFEGETLGSLTTYKMREWLSKKKLSRKRLHNLLTPLRGAIAQAIDDGNLKEDPIQTFKIGRRAEAPREVIDPFTPEELKALGQTPCGQIWIFWAFTGLRTAELIGLRWEDVSRDLGSIRIWRSVRYGREKRTKTSSGVRTVALLEPARRVLRSMERHDGQVVFTHPGTGNGFYGDKPIRLLFHRDCAEAQVRRRTGPYALRHTFASLALSAGEPLSWVSTTMGHRDQWVTLKAYSKWVPSAMPEAGQRLAATMV
jgi:integrase